MAPALFSNIKKSITHGAGEGHCLGPFFHILSEQCFVGCILVFEYLYFLLQSNKDEKHASLELAINTYHTSGTQATVANSLQNAIDQHYGDNHDTLSRAIIDIILSNQMCKLSPL